VQPNALHCENADVGFRFEFQPTLQISTNRPLRLYQAGTMSGAWHGLHRICFAWLFVTYGLMLLIRIGNMLVP
jgi:hypothetical protein